MNPTVLLAILLSAMLLLSLLIDRRRSERDWRAEESSMATGFQKWLLDCDHPLAALSEPVDRPERKQTLLRVSGNVPPEHWSRLATVLQAKLPSGMEVSAALDVSLAIDASQGQSVTQSLNYLISELELSGLRIALVEQAQAKTTAPQAERPRKSRRCRVVIRFHESDKINPLLKSLLWLAPARPVGMAS